MESSDLSLRQRSIQSITRDVCDIACILDMHLSGVNLSVKPSHRQDIHIALHVQQRLCSSRFDLDSSTFHTSCVCLCECCEVNKYKTQIKIIDFIMITQSAYFPMEVHNFFFKCIILPALRYHTVPIWIHRHTRAHTHTPHHTQCLVFRFIKPQCYPEWLTG